MKTIYVLISIMLACSALKAQPGWTWRSPLPQGNPLHSISFVRDYGMAVGAGGTVLHTKDGGASWRLVDLGTLENLNDVVMHDDLIAFIAGDNGLLLYTLYHVDEDSFEVKKLSSNTLEDLNAITSDINGCPWTAGDKGVVLRSPDFGQTWVRQTPYFDMNIADFHNIECTEAWGVGKDGAVIYTYDLGNTWSYRSVITTWDLLSIHVGTFENIRVCGQQGTIWKTTDKGLTWIKEHEEPGYNLFGIVNAGLNCAYAAGDEGKILETTDYGATWEERKTGISTTLFNIAFHGLGYDEIWAVGHYGTMLKNTTVGSDFNLQLTGIPPYIWLMSVEFINDSTAIAVGGDPGYGGTTDGMIFKTTDGGKTWIRKLKDSKPFRCVDFINETTGWAVGSGGIIRYTKSAGETWGTQNSGVMSHINAVSFADEKNGWAVTMWAEIIHTSNGGTTWTRQTNPDPNPLHDVFFVNESLGFAVGLDSTIMRTTNGGQEWKRMITRSKQGYRFASVFFIDKSYGWVAGIMGSLMLTTDGGDTWTQIETGVDETFNDVFFIDHMNGWLSGDKGTILRSVDGGRTWFRQYTGVSTNLLCSINFRDPLNGCATGEGGTIITTNNGGFGKEPGTFRHDFFQLPIQDLETVRDSIYIFLEDEYFLSDMEVFIDSIIHPSVSDLEIYLEHDGLIDTLMFHTPHNGSNILWTRFSDHAGRNINTGIPSFSGEYRPIQDLSLFHGTDPSGYWTLRIHDSSAGDSGTLRSWGIRPLYSRVTSVEPSPRALAEAVILEQNFPNPATGSTLIKWNQKESSKTRLLIYSVEGRLISELFNACMPAGEHSIEVNVSALPPGMYFYRLVTIYGSITRKMLIY